MIEEHGKTYSVSTLKEWMEKRYPAEPGFPVAITDRIKPKVQRKKVFLSTSFHDEHKLARKALKIGISEYILTRTISQSELELMEPKYCFDAEDVRGPEKLRDRAKPPEYRNTGFSKDNYTDQQVNILKTRFSRF